MLTLRQSHAFTFRGGILLGSMLAAVLVAALLGPAGYYQRLLRLRPLAWLGERSYAVYLWHWPVILVLDELLPTAHDSAAHWAVRALAVTVTLALAAASYRLLEQPVRRHGFRGAGRRARRALTSRVPARRVVAGGLAALTGAATVVTVAAIAVAPERSQTQARIEAAQGAVDASAVDARAVDVTKGDFSVPTGKEITGFGDSIVVTSADGLEARFPGIMLDARSVRRWTDGEAAVRSRLAEGTVRRAVFLDFGTNAGVSDEALVRRVLDALGPDRMIVVVNLYGASEWIPTANETLANIVSSYSNAIIADWHGAISARPELLQADGVHPGLEGAHLYADVVARAFAELSERLTGVPVDLSAETPSELPERVTGEGGAISGGADDAGAPAGSAETGDDPAATGGDPTADGTGGTGDPRATDPSAADDTAGPAAAGGTAGPGEGSDGPAVGTDLGTDPAAAGAEPGAASPAGPTAP
ncbi:acyltransferase family protein [Georgenia sp. AZ-5]|uniref:acyltransferase family protein n=1 Tax=Georgenia sp. AZ-5 TaxID=3367526 RepID=UPI0037545E19